MDYNMEKIDKILEENLTENSFKLWKALKEKIPDIWCRSSSSTGKYHRRRDGTIPSVGEHTWEMLVTGIKLLSIFNVRPKTLDADILLLSIVLHDSWKYGDKNPINASHTNEKHNRIVADKIGKNRDILLRIFSERQVSLLVECLRFHSGRWSGESDRFNFRDHSPAVLFIHILDMLSTNALLCIEDEQGAKNMKGEKIN